MTKTYNFSKDSWDFNDFMYVYSPVCKAYKEFIQLDNCIANSYNEQIGDWDYISIVTKQKYTAGTKVSTKCSFDKFGAPLIVFTNDIRSVDGRNEYVLHFEAVAYENGFNVWHIVPWPERTERPIKPTKICFEDFKVEDGSVVDLAVEFKQKVISVTVNGVTAEVANDDMPDSFHVGITACEGVNKFYDLIIED
ncbi:MAG: hypothetical protein IJ365_08250 [Clostridia bacterium]|nr:hypothetical protein [Clostridia bacterium]